MAGHRSTAYAMGASLVAVTLLLSGVLAAAAMAAEDACPVGAADTHATAARVTEVVNARTLKLADGRRLRIAGVEPFDVLRPELSAAEALLMQRLPALTEAAPLAVQPIADAPDRYGRTPALLWAGAELVQERLIGEGLALAFASGDPLPCFDRLLAAEEAARRDARGFWTGEALPNADPESLAALIGRFAIVEGTILSVGNRSTRTYLNFGARWSEDMTVEIAAGDRKRFGGKAKLAALAGQRVRMRGFLQEKSGPMMAIRSPMQLEVLGAATVAQGSTP